MLVFFLLKLSHDEIKINIIKYESVPSFHKFYTFGDVQRHPHGSSIGLEVSYITIVQNH
jgi:hypothetical protein